MGYNEDCAKIWNPTGPITIEVRPDPFTKSTYDVWAVRGGYAQAITAHWFKDRKQAEDLFLSKSYYQWMEELSK